MNAQQLERYGILMQTLGSRQFLGSPLPSPWGGCISSNYGYRQHPVDGGLSLHRGLDIASPTGTPVLAIHSGSVTFVQPYDSGEYGIYLIIEDSKGIRSIYAHCSHILVTQGQEVSAGDIIAEVGNTGLSTGPHLHLEVQRNGVYLNPLFYLEGY